MDKPRIQESDKTELRIDLTSFKTIVLRPPWFTKVLSRFIYGCLAHLEYNYNLD